MVGLAPGQLILECSVEAEPAPEIEWHRGGILLQVGPFISISGASEGAEGLPWTSLFMSTVGTSSTLMNSVTPYSVYSKTRVVPGVLSMVPSGYTEEFVTQIYDKLSMPTLPKGPVCS